MVTYTKPAQDQASQYSNMDKEKTLRLHPKQKTYSKLIGIEDWGGTWADVCSLMGFLGSSGWFFMYAHAGNTNCTQWDRLLKRVWHNVIREMFGYLEKETDIGMIIININCIHMWNCQKINTNIQKYASQLLN